MRATHALRNLVRHTLAAPSPLIRSRGPVVPQASLPASLADDFAIYPDFFSPSESRALLQLALWKLDRVDSKRKRRRRGAAPGEGKEKEKTPCNGAQLQDVFTGPYGFEEGHFDSVIHQYRESLITSLPPDAGPELARVLARLYALVPGLKVPPESEVKVTDMPPPASSTHALHLAPEGAILAHVDNRDASGQTIVGASLGATRILRLERENDPEKQGWDILLPSGSVYMQKGSVRYDYAHSILPFGRESMWEGVPLPPGHRVSFMVRDAPTRQAQL